MKHLGKAFDQHEQTLSLCHKGLMPNDCGHLFNQPLFLLFTSVCKTNVCLISITQS